MFESRLAEKASIRGAVERRIESFASNKGGIIRSVLDQPFHKVILNHLVVNNGLVLEPVDVKSKVDEIIVGWTRNIGLPSEAVEYVSGCWECAYFVEESVGFDDSETLKLGWSSYEHSAYCADQDCQKDSLQDMFTQFLVFAVGSVVEDALEKNRELWLVLQNMSKAYDSIGWYHLEVSLKCIKMCSRFISFFDGIHNDRINRVMTDFGLSNGYCVHDNLSQGEVFSSLLWRIFYDPLLCEVKQHEHLCGYKIDTKFVARTGRIENSGGMSSFFAAGAFVDNTIWYALNIASEFFSINDISINNEKMVAILINQGVKVASLSISGQPISIAKKGKAYRYLGIFLLTERLFKPSLAKAHSDVRFFTNVVLRKAITGKQFSYLISAVL
ncbi:hypothetical protein G9A89_022871 [Geosiphon pyriformis]|nr:hypothetical protein G9A89_022871 [Geosiphon pyriformis]